MDGSLPIVALVDDDKIFQLTALKTIQATSLAKHILQFENGEDALKYLDENRDQLNKLPDYIFLDINMPFVDGWMFLDDFTSLKSKLAKTVTIYMVSSSIDPKDINKAKTYEEVTGYVVKPVSKEKFVEILQRAA